MPGTPEHPIGLSGTVAVSLVVASVAALAARTVTTVPQTAVGGVCYALGLLGVWAGSRHLFHRIGRSREHALWFVVCVVVLVAAELVVVPWVVGVLPERLPVAVCSDSPVSLRHSSSSLSLLSVRFQW